MTLTYLYVKLVFLIFYMFFLHQLRIGTTFESGLFFLNFHVLTCDSPREVTICTETDQNYSYWYFMKIDTVSFCGITSFDIFLLGGGEVYPEGEGVRRLLGG